MYIALSSPLMLAGCMTGPAIPVSSTQLGYRSEDILLSYDAPKRPMIRIDRFEDKRAERQRKGEQPEGHFMLLYSWREGAVVTGDEAWAGSGGESGVSGAVTSTLGEAIRASNFFAQTTVGSKAGVPGGNGYILIGDIQSLYAEQDYSYSGMFLLLFWDSSKSYGNPVGHCKLNYTLLDAATNRPLLHGSVEAEASHDSLSESGAAALALAETRLTNDLTKFLKSEK